MKDLIKEKAEKLLDHVDDYEAGSEEAQTATQNAKQLVELDLRYEEQELEKQRLLNESEKIHNDNVRNKIEIGTKIGFGVITIGMWLTTLKEDEVQPALSKMGSFVKDLAKRIF